MTRIGRTLKKITILWLALSAIPLSYYLHLTRESHTFLIDSVISQGEQFLSFVDERASDHHDENIQNFRRLSHSSLLRDYATSDDPNLKAYLIDQWVTTATNIKSFSQLRFLNHQGQEKIRVDLGPNMTEPYVVPDDELQFKGTRDYFIYAKKLAEGETGDFGLDIEYENQRPVIPLQPGFRMMYPIDVDGKRYGYFIANLDVMRLIRTITSNPQHYEVDFIDKDGSYILSSDPSKLFGQLIEQQASNNLAKNIPNLWQAIQAAPQKQGSILDDEGLRVFRAFHTRLFDTSDGLTLITTIPTKEIEKAFAMRTKSTKSDAIIQFFVLGLVAGLLALFWETYEQSKLEQTFSELIFDHTVAVAMTDENHRILRVNSRLCQLLGKESSQLRGLLIFDIQSSPTEHYSTLRALNKTGEWSGQWRITPQQEELIYKVEVSPTTTNSMGKRGYYVYSFSDVSEQHRALLSFKDQSERDSSTSLWNKEKFNHTLAHYSRLQARYSNQPKSCLAIVDIDNFKNINDNLGHKVGDEIILQLTSQMLSILRDTDFVARIGGDEFAIILQHSDTQIAFNMMQRICKTVATQMNYPVTISIGLADITSNPNQTFVNADKALYLSKQKGKNCVSSHDPLSSISAPKDT